MAEKHWSDIPTGTIAYCSREMDGYPGFAACLARLAQKHPLAKIVQIITNNIAEGRNQAVLQAEGDWIWFIDVDMLFAADVLKRLLAHDVDLVQTLCLLRHPPHSPIMWTHDRTQRDEALSGRPRLVEVASLGAGGTLYKKRVFEAIKGPWFEGVLGMEDTNFAAKCKAAGFKLHVDTSTPVTHLTPMGIRPVYDDVTGAWGVRYEAMNGQSVTMMQESPIVRPELALR